MIRPNDASAVQPVHYCHSRQLVRRQLSESRQSISACPSWRKPALILETGLLPKNPLWAESGDGCTDWMIVWRVASISRAFFCAYEPHKTKTTPGLELAAVITASVNDSHPLPACELGSPA